MDTMPKKKETDGEKQRLFDGLFRRDKQRILVFGAIVLVVLFCFLFLLPKGKNTKNGEVALHYADSWKDVGAIDGCFFFRDGKNLIAFDAGGKRWEMPLAAETKPIYGEKLYLLQKDHSLQVLNPKNGHEERVIQENGLIGLVAVEKRAFSPAACIGIKADRFVVFDVEGKIKAVQKTAGSPGLLAQTDTHAAWTEEGTAKNISVEGQVEKAPGFSSPYSTEYKAARSTLAVQALSAEKAKEKNEEDSSAEARFQLNADRAFTRLLWTGESSLVAAQDYRLYFVANKAVTATIPCGESWDMTVNEEGVWVTDGRALTCYTVEGKVKKTIALDFPPLRVVAGKNGVVVVGKNRRMTVKGEKKEVVDTQELIRVLPQANGATMLVYREAFFVLP